MRLIKKFCLLLAFLFCVCFFGCTEKAQPLSFWAFNTEVIIAGQEKPLSRAVENQIRTLFSDLEKEFALDSNSSFSKSFNSASVGSTLALSDHALNVMLLAKTAHALTDGFFDPTVYPLVKLWGFSPYQFTPQFNPPSSEQISTLLPNVNFNSIVLNEQQKTVTKTENVQLDLGGIVKGYASTLAKNILRENGYKKGYISVGGSSLSLLNSKSLGVRHPRATTEVLFTVNCSNYNFVDLSTSGDYEKYHVGIDGKRYCHLINPFTGTPTNTGVASATIIGVDGAISDALTTALCLLPHQKNEPNSPLIEKINAIIQTYPNCSVYLVFDNGNDKLLITNKTQDIDFTLRDADYSVVKI
ncbi:MAG: FAD:protein FMN transferase [Clostridiales bacterium]|nr:FAD:protein FMN transferase [Clostridiales bacterium]